MVNFVLDYLCGPTGKGFDASLKLGGLPLNFNGLVTLAGAGTAQQGKAALSGVV